MPNKLVTAVTLLVYIQNVSGSNLSQDTEYPDCGILRCSSRPPDKYQDHTLDLTMATSFQILSNTLDDQTSYYLTLYRLSYWQHC
jgi:hypothetical protein